jgi:hypothetical protein
MRLRVSYLLILISLTPPCLLTQETADTLLKKHVQAMGGMDRIKTILSARCTANVWFNGLEGHVIWAEKWPSSSLREVHWPNGNVRLLSTDSPERSDLPEKLRLPTEEVFGELVAYSFGFGPENKVEYLGQRDEEGAVAQVIILHRPDGRLTSYYLDPTTFLPFKIILEDPKDPLPTVVYLGGWYYNGDIAFHRREDHYRNGQLFESLTKLEYVLNPPIDDGTFARELSK